MANSPRTPNRWVALTSWRQFNAKLHCERRSKAGDLQGLPTLKNLDGCRWGSRQTLFWLRSCACRVHIRAESNDHYLYRVSPVQGTVHARPRILRNCSGSADGRLRRW